MYESPITIISNGIQLSLKDEVYKAVEQIGIKVDKNELIKALKYDREQYEKGYADAKAEQRKGKWVYSCFEGAPACSECGCTIKYLEMSRYWYCPNCGARMNKREEE